jgi:hypothetical protein
MEKKPFFKQLSNTLQKKCLDGFDKKRKSVLMTLIQQVVNLIKNHYLVIRESLRKRGVRLLCNMIENKKEETTSIKH